MSLTRREWGVLVEGASALRHTLIVLKPRESRLCLHILAGLRSLPYVSSEIGVQAQAELTVGSPFKYRVPFYRSAIASPAPATHLHH